MRLEGAKLLLLDDPHCLRDQALEICDRARASVQVGLLATSLGAIVQWVRRGLGATLLPSLAIEVEMSRLPELKIKQFAPPVPGRTLGIAWRKGSLQGDHYKLPASILKARRGRRGLGRGRRRVAPLRSRETGALTRWLADAANAEPRQRASGTTGRLCVG
jgi:LysR family hydrogen peroxide-inducible transcriptional activator